MALFHGCCIYAHGGFVTAALLASSFVGVVCTLYSALSCRLVKVEYSSENGNFDTMFTQKEGNGNVESYTTGAGLFYWLAPGDSWDKGTCTGYTESTLNVIADNVLEACRFMIVVAILIGMGVTMWVLSLACISLGPKQIYLLAGCQMLLVILVCLTFLVLQSDLCSNVGQETVCQVDEGGLAVIVAAISWFVGFFITVYFMKSPEKQRREREEEIQRRAEELAEKKREKKVLKRKEREAKARELAILEQEMTEQEEAMAYRSSPEEARALTRGASTPATVESGGDSNDMEITISRSLDRIEHLLDERNDYI